MPVIRTAKMRRKPASQPTKRIVIRTHIDRPVNPKLASVRDEEARREVQSFLHALRTYPDRFACEPKLSFEQHFFQVAAGLPEVLRKAPSI